MSKACALISNTSFVPETVAFSNSIVIRLEFGSRLAFPSRSISLPFLSMTSWLVGLATRSGFLERYGTSFLDDVRLAFRDVLSPDPWVWFQRYRETTTFFAIRSNTGTPHTAIHTIVSKTVFLCA